MKLFSAQYHRKRGFTLIEVVIAMAIVAIAMVALIEATGTYVKNTSFLRDKVIAHWVASNVLNELLLKQSFPSKTEKQGDESMAGQKWAWKVKVVKTPDKAFRSVEVKVFKGESKNSLSTLVSYVSSAVAECEKANPQQLNCQSWSSGSSSGGNASSAQNAK